MFSRYFKRISERLDSFLDSLFARIKPEEHPFPKCQRKLSLQLLVIYDSILLISSRKVFYSPLFRFGERVGLRRVRADGSFPFYDFADAGLVDVGFFRQAIGTDLHRDQKIFLQDFSGHRYTIRTNFQSKTTDLLLAGKFIEKINHILPCRKSKKQNF